MELWPLLLFLLLISGTAGAGNANFFFFRNSTLPGNFLWPRAVPNLPAHYGKIKKPDSHPVLEFLSSNKQDYFFLLKR
jgi:hypothetical protein